MPEAETVRDAHKEPDDYYPVSTSPFVVLRTNPMNWKI